MNKNLLNNILIDACKRGKTDTVERIILKGADVNIEIVNKDIDEIDTPLTIACKNFDLFMVKLLLNNGARVNIPLKEGENEIQPLQPLIAVCYAEYNLYQIEIAKLLIERGATVNFKENLEQYTPLTLACRFNNFKLVVLLLENGANPNYDENDPSCPLPLPEAISNNNLDIINLLIDYGANINFIDEEGDSLLKRAIDDNKYNIAKLLINKGVNINQYKPEGEHRYSGYTLLSEFSSFDGFFYNPRAIRFLLENGANVNLPNNGTEITPIKIAHEKNNTNLIAMLLAYGANPDDIKHHYDKSVIARNLWKTIQNNANNIKIENEMLRNEQDIYLLNLFLKSSDINDEDNTNILKDFSENITDFRSMSKDILSFLPKINDSGGYKYKKSCKKGLIRSRKTGRCRSKSRKKSYKKSLVRNKSKPRKKSCKKGLVRSRKTGRCRSKSRKKSLKSRRKI